MMKSTRPHSSSIGVHGRSEPVDSDERLMTVVRYIHQNPWKAGVTADSGLDDLQAE